VGEGGGALSGGEKQRISIARAILKNAPIVLLDEATANIDPENEVYIQEAINELVKNKTLVIIAHRLNTIKDANQIVVMNDGRIDDVGKHEELIKNEGIYKRFWDIRQNANAWKVTNA
ncbi:MAG: ATP-binding cassette domain-containing protein, partial [Clostridium sp.]|nr:ATP-binding cassette domain-containing protein [Clostridium sp.]